MSYLTRTTTVANGSQTAFPVSFPFQSRDDVAVYVRASTTSDPGEALVADTDYEWTSDGIITFTAAPEAGMIVDIRRSSLETALDNILNAPSTIKAAELKENDTQLLYLVQEAQDMGTDHAEILGRSLRGRYGETFNELPAAADRAGMYPVFDPSGQPILSSGTGNDPALRQDLAAEGGVDLVFGAASMLDTATLRYYGFGRGATGDATAALNTALAAFAAAQDTPGLARVKLERGSTLLFGTDDDLVIPANVVLDLNGGTLIPGSDRDLITLGQRAFLINGIVDINSGIGAFTNAAVVIPSTTVSWLGSGSGLVDLNILGVNPGSLAAPTGTAVRFDVAALKQHRVSWSSITGCYISWVHTGVACDIPLPVDAANAAQGNFASSNRVDGQTTFYDVVNAVRGSLVAGAYSSMGQWIFDFAVQALSKATLERALLWDGEAARGTINGWDIYGRLADGIAIETTYLSNRNSILGVAITDDQVINHSVSGGANDIQTFGGDVGHTQTLSTPPFSNPLPVVSGQQDNYLAFGGTRSGWTITVTDGGGTPVAPTTGSVANLFDPDPNKFVRYASYNGTLHMVVDMATSVTKPQMAGMAFGASAIPDLFSIETSATGAFAGEEVLLYDKYAEGSVGQFENWHSRGTQAALRYWRFTMENNSAKDITIYSVWAMFGGAKGKAFGSKYQPDFESQISVDGTKVMGPRNTGWTADTGTAEKGAHATYTKGGALTVSAAYSQAEVQAIVDRQALVEQAVQDVTRTVKALKDKDISHGNIGT